MYCKKNTVRPESWILEKVLLLEIKSRKKIQSPKFFYSYKKCVISEFFFPVVKPISPVAKTFNHRMRSFMIFLCLHYTMVTARLQCMMKIVLFPCFSRSLLITYLITFSLEKWIHVLVKKSEKSLEICMNSDQDNVKHDQMCNSIWNCKFF